MKITKMSEFIKFAEEVINKKNNYVKIEGTRFSPVYILKKLDYRGYRAALLNIADKHKINLSKLEKDVNF